MCDDIPIDTILPVNVSAEIVTFDDRPEFIVLQSLSTIATVVVWMTLMCSTRRRRLSRIIQGVARGTALLASLAIALVAWRVVQLYECDSGIAESVTVWRVLVSGGVVVGAFIIVVPLSLRFPSLAILAVLASAAGTVVVDVGLRGWWVVSPASIPLVYAQHLCNTIAALLFFTLPKRGAITFSSFRSSTPRVEVVDALEARKPHAPASCPAPSSWSWFS